MQSPVEIKIKQARLLDKFFTCAREKEEEYIKQIALLSTSLVIDINADKERHLRSDYSYNRYDVRGSAYHSDLGIPLLFPAIIFSPVGSLLIYLGLASTVSGLSVVMGGFILAIGAVCLIATILIIGRNLYDTYKENKAKESFGSEFDLERKLGVLVASKQFELIDCPHLHFKSQCAQIDMLHTLDDALNLQKTIVHLPAKDKLSFTQDKYPNEWEKLLRQKREAIEEKSKGNACLIKHNVFFQETSLLPELRVIIFKMLKSLYFPTGSFPLYKEINSAPNQLKH